MQHALKSVSLVIALVLLGGCASLPFGGTTAETAPPPTLDPALLTVTPYPTSTPQPTYTPYPTAERLPTRTPLPAMEAGVASPPDVEASSGEPAASGGVIPSLPSAPSRGDIGIPEAGVEGPELVPILEVLTRDATCNDEILVQLGVVNWGDAPAADFTVEWSAGVDIESGVTTIDALQWGEAPVYFRNKRVRYNCEAPTTFTAFVRVDTTNAVQEVYEDNNVAELTFTLPAPASD